MEEEEEKAEPTNWRPWACWALVTPFAVWALARTFGLEAGYPFVQAMAYTPYVLVLALIVLLLVVLLRQWLPFLLGLLAVIALAVAVIPRELGSPDEVTGGKEVNLMAFNLARGRADLLELKDLVESRQIDLFALQEVTPEAAEELDRIGIGRFFPYSNVQPGRPSPGGAIYSRYPLEPLGMPSTEFNQPDALVSVPGAVRIRLRSVHPMAPAGPRTTRTWEDEYGAFPSASEGGPPWVLAGDFNATLDHENLRELIGTGYRDAGDTIGLGLVSTWPSTLKLPLPVTLDHVLAEKGIAITGYDVEAIDDSDHRAVFADLVLPAL